MTRKLGNARQAVVGVDVDTDSFCHLPPPRGFRRVIFNNAPFDVRKGYSLTKCTSEAHGNPHIDNCAQCAPLWGVVAVKDSKS